MSDDCKAAMLEAGVPYPCSDDCACALKMRVEELEAKLAEYKHVASALDNQWCDEMDENEALKAQLAERQWQPIETAPRDGTNFDVWIDWRGRVADVFHDGDNFRELALNDMYGASWDKLDGTPTHWMPIPGQPEQNKTET